MLLSLDIRDILIIDRLELDFSSGLNVLTGETGAGKSILLDSLGFVLGWRGRAELVRAGAAQGEVTASFYISTDHPVQEILLQQDFEPTDELIIRRVNTAEGRKTAWVNGRRVSGEVLRQLSQHLLELHGQHDDRGLLDARGHMDLLDAYASQRGDHNALLQSVRDAWKTLSQTQKAIHAEQEKQQNLVAEEDFLRHSVDELNKIDPQVGEDEELDARRRFMQSSEKIKQDIAKAYQLLGREGAETMLGDATRWIEGVAEKAEGQLDDAISAISRAMIELSEASATVERTLEQLEFNPHELEEVEERLFSIRALARKHGVHPDELGVFSSELSQRLNALDDSESRLSDLEHKLEQAQKYYDEQADLLRQSRKNAAELLDQSMASELAPLKMERAVFKTEITQSAPSSLGIDAVGFCVATNPGAPAGPLAKIASGGELSRFLLALKVSLSRDDAQNTVIFDEIDRGVGGATADAVGRRLSDLAKNAQILVVTHSPQVAAMGNKHFQVRKFVKDEQTLSQVSALNTDQRIDEIARMISGSHITPEAQSAAKTLLERGVGQLQFPEISETT